MEGILFIKYNPLHIKAYNQPLNSFVIQSQLKIPQVLYNGIYAWLVANYVVIDKSDNIRTPPPLTHDTIHRRSKKIYPFEVYSGIGVMVKTTFKGKAITFFSNYLGLQNILIKIIPLYASANASVTLTKDHPFLTWTVYHIF